MAIFHCNIQIIGKSDKRSAVAASAYRSGTKLYDESSKHMHDYGRKGGVVYSEVMLPVNAPAEHVDRAVLWNSVQAVEKNRNAQLAREVEVALPKELSRDQQIELVRKYIKKNFVSKGMAADVSIHDKGDGNPHAHIMLTMRSYKEDGSWAQKQKKVYQLDNAGRKVPVIDKKTGRQKLGAGNRKQWKFRMVPTTNWNDRRNAELWRASWAEECNRYLAPENHIDHRSYARQGLDVIPTMHEGYAARQMERRGEVSNRCQDNRAIRQKNAEMEELKSGMKALEEDMARLDAEAQAIISSMEPSANRPKTTQESLYEDMEHNLARMIGEDRPDYTLASAERLWREYARKRGSSPAAKLAADRPQTQPQPHQRPKRVDRRAAIFAAKYGNYPVAEPVPTPSVREPVAHMQPETVPDTVAPVRPQVQDQAYVQPEKRQHTPVVPDAVPSSAEERWWVPESVAEPVAEPVADMVAQSEAEPMPDMVAQSEREREDRERELDLERNLERKDREKRQQIRTSQPNRGRLQVQFNRKKYSPAMQDTLDEIHANDSGYKDRTRTYEQKPVLHFNPRSSQEFEDLMNSIEVDTDDDYGFDY